MPDPDKLMSTRELAAKFADRLPKSAQAIATQQAIVELKPVSPEDYFLRKAEKPRGLYWIKSTSPLPADDSDPAVRARVSVRLLPDVHRRADSTQCR